VSVMPYNDGNEGDAVARVYKYLERLSSSEMIGAYLTCPQSLCQCSTV
jgi:hypothetical protein